MSLESAKALVVWNQVCDIIGFVVQMVLMYLRYSIVCNFLSDERCFESISLKCLVMLCSASRDIHWVHLVSKLVYLCNQRNDSKAKTHGAHRAPAYAGFYGKCYLQ